MPIKSWLKKLFPLKLKRYIRKQFELERQQFEKTLPKYELTSRHISNLQVVENRHRLLELLPRDGIVAEIGVDRGDFSEEILKKCLPSQLHLIDIWNSERYHQGLKNLVEEKFKNEIESGKVKLSLGLSTDVGKTFRDAYFDWVYIDTAHSYNVTREELELYGKKVKPNGIIAGHDFIQGNWIGGVRYGVIEAIHEYCVKNDWELIYLTMELGIPPSFAIRKIK